MNKPDIKALFSRIRESAGKIKIPKLKIQPPDFKDRKSRIRFIIIAVVLVLAAVLLYRMTANIHNPAG